MTGWSASADRSGFPGSSRTRDEPVEHFEPGRAAMGKRVDIDRVSPDRRPVFGPPVPSDCDFVRYGHWCGVCQRGLDPLAWALGDGPDAYDPGVVVVIDEMAALPVRDPDELRRLLRSSRAGLECWNPN